MSIADIPDTIDDLAAQSENAQVNGPEVVIHDAKYTDLNAEAFLKSYYNHPDRYTLTYHRKDFYRWTGTNWAITDRDEVEAAAQHFLERAVYWTKPRGKDSVAEKVKFPIGPNSVVSLVETARRKVTIDYEGNRTNEWIKRPAGYPDARDVVPLQNGILNVRTRELLPHTPHLFNKYAVQFDYDANAPEPVEWFTFLNSIYLGDDQRALLLQQMLGYLCTPDMKQHKMFVLVGPTRAGKGTIFRLLLQLVGDENMGSTTFSELGSAHGLQGIADKSVVSIGDAVTAGRNPGDAMQALLNIVGEDKVSVNPKGKKAYPVKLPCRFIMAANTMPELPDKDGALRDRTMLLRFTRSFTGHEDRDLDDKLARELPSIFNWALDGLDKLRASKTGFVQPDIGKDDIERTKEITSPAEVFAEDMCEFDPTYSVPVKELYLYWQEWLQERGTRNEDKGMARLSNSMTSLRNRQVSEYRPRTEGPRPRFLQGLRLSGHAEAEYRARVEMRMRQDQF